MIIDRLYDIVEKNGHVCLGLDTALNYLPEYFLKQYENPADALFNYNKKIIDATLDAVACYKVQIAYYEALGIDGMIAYKNTLKYLREKEAFIIADIKRGDIAATAEMYAKGHFTGDFEADMVTLSPYMGMDSLTPYMKYFRENEKGAFVLVKTSNEGSKDIQFIEDKNGKLVYKNVAELLMKAAEEFKGKYGYSSIGAVVGCTNLDEARMIRKEMQDSFFLIPGYGAQGGTADDVRVLLKDGNGGVVNSSRAILLAYKKKENGEMRFDECAREEALKMRGEILNAVKL